MQKVGLTIGKFAPFHKGHEYLIRTALKEVDVLYVLIYETNVIDIDIETRKKWLKQTFKNENIKIIKALEPPTRYGMDNNSIKIQIDYIVKILKENQIRKIDKFFSSEEYGKYVAERLNSENIVVDKKRVNIPINATNIRKDVEKYKKYLNKEVYNSLKKHVE